MRFLVLYSIFCCGLTITNHALAATEAEANRDADDLSRSHRAQDYQGDSQVRPQVRSSGGLTNRDPRAQSYQNRNLRRQGSGDIQRAIEQARAEHGGGKVLSADPINFQGQDGYRVKLLTTNGRVKVVQVNPSDSTRLPAPNKYQPTISPQPGERRKFERPEPNANQKINSAELSRGDE